MATASSFWCYSCSRLVRIWEDDVIVCPECDGGFLEAVETPPRLTTPPTELRRRRTRRSSIDVDEAPPPPRASELRFPRRRRAAPGDRSPFNPVIVLRGGADGAAAVATDTSSFELYYDDGAGSGLRPLPASMSNFLMGSGFDRLLSQLAQIEVNGIGGGRGFENPPASKASVESMPTIEISADHVIVDSHCAVCKEAFELGVEAREMPCKHIYHQDCILPWLSLRNSCPVCRHEMPADAAGTIPTDGDEPDLVNGAEEETIGLTIWRLPGGGFAVGQFSGGRRAGERELPVVYTEMDGGFNNGGTPRRISWTSRGSRSRESGGVGRALRNFFSFFRRRRSSSSSTSPRSISESAPSPHGHRGSTASRRASLFRGVSRAGQ